MDRAATASAVPATPPPAPAALAVLAKQSAHTIVSAVVHEPFGCHPSFAQGFYDRDNDFYVRWREISQNETLFNRYLEEWVYGLRDRGEYVRRMGAQIDRLKARADYCEPVNYGY